jgi:hypothetical protein
LFSDRHRKIGLEIAKLGVLSDPNHSQEWIRVTDQSGKRCRKTGPNCFQRIHSGIFSERE